MRHPSSPKLGIGKTSQLASKCFSLEASLAALSAARPPELSGALQEAVPKRAVERVESVGRSCQDDGVRSSLDAIMEAIQSLGTRVDSIESRNSTDRASSSHMLAPPVPVLPARIAGLGGGDGDGDGDGDDDGEDDDELVPDHTPHSQTSPVSEPTERELVDARAFQHSKIDPLPSTAANFRSWKTQLLLLVA